MRVTQDLTTRRRALQLAATAAAVFRPSASTAAQKLEFVTTPSGLRWADIKAGTGDLAVDTGSRVTFHAIGRLVGKQGWVYVNTQADDDDPYRLVCGDGSMIAGVDEGLRGMRAGGTRRLVIPSPLGYQDRSHEPSPRSFGQKQRLYTTVLNENRLRQEAEGLGAGNDVAGVVAIDVEMINVRPPARSVASRVLVPAAAAAELDWSDAVFSAPTATAAAAKAQNTQVASALLLPLFAYKVGALINGVKLQWYLDATIAFAAVSLVVFASK